MHLLDTDTLTHFRYSGRSPRRPVSLCHLQRHGSPRTLHQIMAMDGAARAFAGITPQLPPDELGYTAEVIAPFLASTDFALQFACLFGDEAARSAGYTPQGVGPYAGFELALEQAVQKKELIDGFNREIELTRQNQELMKLLDERGKQTKTFKAAEVKR